MKYQWTIFFIVLMIYGAWVYGVLTFTEPKDIKPTPICTPTSIKTTQ